MNNPAAISANDVRHIADTLLDKQYAVVTSPVIAGIYDSPSRRLVDRRSTELTDEIKRLKASGKSINESNAVLRAFLADLDTWLKRVAQLIDVNAPAIQRSGIDAAAPISRALALPGVSDAQLANAGIDWREVDGDVIHDVLDITKRPAWGQSIKEFSTNILSIILNAIATLIESDPLGMVSAFNDIMDMTVRSFADGIMRTLQLNAEREAVASIGVVNSDIVTRQIRVALLDDRTCLACIALHGTELPIGETVDDHNNGRCQAVLIISGRDINIETGVQYFNGLSDEEQSRLMGNANFAAYQAGHVELGDFVHRYHDDTFGAMLRQASLKGILGNEAERFYRNKPTGKGITGQ